MIGCTRASVNTVAVIRAAASPSDQPSPDTTLTSVGITAPSDANVLTRSPQDLVVADAELGPAVLADADDADDPLALVEWR